MYFVTNITMTDINCKIVLSSLSLSLSFYLSLSFEREREREREKETDGWTKTDRNREKERVREYSLFCQYFGNFHRHQSGFGEVVRLPP